MLCEMQSVSSRVSVYIVIHIRTDSLYHNLSVWRDIPSRDRNPPKFTLGWRLKRTLNNGIMNFPWVLLIAVPVECRNRLADINLKTVTPLYMIMNKIYQNIKRCPRVNCRNKKFMPFTQ